MATAASSSSSSSSAFLPMANESQTQIHQEQLVPGAQEAPDHRQNPVASSASSNKKRRNKAGNPNPDAEVIALSPRTLMTTNRFVCEVCNKGFQREQNLQLHRRGHNLPWKLKQKNPKDVRKKVYLCPESSCAHHDPSRALGDLTGIKKHYSRKHREKKYKCEKCSRKYAVQSDWKVHSKICGTRQYRCDCGSVFSRRTTFISHQAFCEALAQESSHNLNPLTMSAVCNNQLGLETMSLGLQNYNTINQPLSNHSMLQLGNTSKPGPQFETVLSPGYQLSTNTILTSLQQKQVPNYRDEIDHLQHGLLTNKPSQLYGQMQLPQLNANISSFSAPSLCNLGFFNGNGVTIDGHHTLSWCEDSTFFSSDILMTNAVPSLYSTSSQATLHQNTAAAHMSATALLQSAAELGSTMSNTCGHNPWLTKSAVESSSTNNDHFSLRNWEAALFRGGNNNGSQLQGIINSIDEAVIGSGGSGSSSFTFGTKYTHNGQEMEADHNHVRSFPAGNYNSGGLNLITRFEQGFCRQLTHDFLGVGFDMSMMGLAAAAQGTNVPSSHGAEFGGPSFIP